MNEIKGYVVKFTNERGTFYVTAPAWLGEHTIGTGADDDGALFDALGKAAAAARHPRRTNDVRIFAVSPDGTETPLPTYEEALNALAMARDATEMALRAHGARGMGGAPSELEGCPPGALRALLRLLGGGR